MKPENDNTIKLIFDNNDNDLVMINDRQNNLIKMTRADFAKLTDKFWKEINSRITEDKKVYI